MGDLSSMHEQDQHSQTMRILGIETSCDETAAAVVVDGRVILSNVVSSQIDLHARYGGVFPEVASRQHICTIYGVIDQALSQAHLTIKDVDGIAVTRGPGLAGSLVVGMNMAKGLAISKSLPFVGINHMEGHIYSAWLIPKKNGGDDNLPSAPKFPLMALLVSGGHSELILMTDHLAYQRLGGTLDDAAGEAFDKVGRLLGLPYPGGPAIQEAAKNGNAVAFTFPRAWLEETWNFSFSGLKTAVLREVQDLEKRNANMVQYKLPIEDLAASFQAAVIDVLVKKTLTAARKFNVREILVAGGVSANQGLRETIQSQSPIPVHIPPLSMCTDNAAMIAAAGFFRHRKKKNDPLNIDVMPTWQLV